MTAHTHIAFGLLSTAGIFSIVSTSLHRDMPAIGCTIIGSLLPDIDTPKSSVGRALPFISGPIERRWGHRTVTHSLLVLLALAVLTTPLAFYRATCFTAFLIGFASHLIADCGTRSGVPLFYPSPAVCVIPGNDRYRVHTGSLLGEGILLIFLLMLLGVLMPISRMGGIWRALRYLTATPRAAYSDYREATSEAVLRFEGRWRESRQPVKGEALILDGVPNEFLIAFEDRALVYGEEGDILPDKSRVKETGRPLRVDTLKVKQKTLEEIRGRIPEGAYLSGWLQADCLFDAGVRERSPGGRHPAVRAYDGALAFEFAPQRQVAFLRPERRVDLDRVAELRIQVLNLSSSLSAMEIKRPPAHYLKLREVREELESRKRQLAHLQDPTVRFSGTLFLRIPGGRE